jgi:hypothetical protein
MATLVINPRIKMIDRDTNEEVNIYDIDHILKSLFTESEREDIMNNLSVSYGDSNLVVFDSDILFEAIEESGADYSQVYNLQDYLFGKQIGIFSA